MLTFAPLPRRRLGPRGSLGREMERRFEAYKKNVVQPFFRDHFARIDRQVVLVDVLGAIHNGPRGGRRSAHARWPRSSGASIPGATASSAALCAGRRVEKILFAATKADHLHHTQHPQLTAIMQALLREARDRARFRRGQTQAMSIAALRTTVEETRGPPRRPLDVVRGRLLDTGKQAAFYPGALPEDPAHLLAPARAGAADWVDGGLQGHALRPRAADPAARAKVRRTSGWTRPRNS